MQMEENMFRVVPLCWMCVHCKIRLNTLYLDTVGVRAVTEDFCCLNEASLKRYGSFRLEEERLFG